MRKVKELGTRDQVNSMLYVTKGRELTRKFLGDNIDKFFKQVINLNWEVPKRQVVRRDVREGNGI